MAYVTAIGSNPEQVEYRLSGRHGCGGTGGSERQFSYRADGRERPLRWIGRGLDGVDIQAGSELTEDQFDRARALMDGRDPRTGERLVEAKRGIPDDAKVALGPLVRAVEAAAAEADVSTDEIFGGHAKSIERFERARRQVQSRGEAARLRADHAGELADRAGIPVEEIWSEEIYAEAVGNLFETVTVTDDDGTQREERRPRRVLVGNAGYDVTFTLPKSFSLLLAFASEEQATEVEAVFMQQVETLFGWLEDQVAYGMRGEHGNGKTASTTPGDGLLGWTMVHRAARPTNDAEYGDPHWHVHLTVANMVRSSEDGQWSTIAAGGRDLMRHIPAVDHLLKATVRHALEQQFGVRYERNERSGAWELVGLPDETLRHFSKRHHDIKEMLSTLGYDDETASRAQDRIAEQRSRGAKGEAVAAADATLQECWQGEELDAGRDPAEHMQRVFGQGGDAGTADPEPGLSPQDLDDAGGSAAVNPSVDEIADALLDPDTGLTAHSRRFSYLDALRRVADALPNGAATVAEVEQLTHQALAATQQFITLPTSHSGGEGADGDVAGPNGATAASPLLGASHMTNSSVFTTADVVDAETVILRAARASRPGQLRTRVASDVRDMAVSLVEAQQDYPLGDEQRAALDRLVGQGRQLDTVNGAPGTGKTTLMRALRVVYEAAGCVVGGAATAAVAAQNLATESGITSRTVASWLHAINNKQDPLRGVDVLVLDEANLTEDRDRSELYAATAAAGTQLIEIGDGRQLRGVGVGSLFSRVHEIVEGHELVNNRRQRDEDERAAIAAWRAGRYAEAFAIWQGRGQLVVTEHADEVTAAMLRHWWDQRQGAGDAHTEMRGLVMLAGTNTQVRRLNEAAQAMRLSEGELGEHRRYDIAGGTQLTLHVGDSVLMRINDRAGHYVIGGPHVLNGYRAVVTDIRDDGSLAVEWQHETDDGLVTEHALLDPSYVAAGGIELGYAITIHKSEGLTVGDQWDGPDGEERGGTVLFHAAGAENPSAHVATSRHKRATLIFDSLEELETEQDRYLLGPPRTRADRDARAIDKLAARARDTLEHGDDRPVVVDLGIEEFLSERGRWERTAEARDEYAAERAEHEQQTAEREQRRAQRAHRKAERAAAAEQRRSGAELLIREVWRHEPSIVEMLLAEAAFDGFARNLADVAEAGYDLREVLAEIPLDVLGADRITNKAQFAARSVTTAVERLRTGAAQRDYDARMESEAFDQAREQVADLLDEVWGRPELVERVAHSGAFDHLVRAFDLADDVGMSVRGLAGQIQPQRLERDTVRDPAAMATYLVRQITQRQLDEREEAEAHAAATQARAEHRQEVIERIRRVWQHAETDAVERIVTGPAIAHFVERIDAAETAGWNTEVLLGRLSPDTLANAPRPSGAAAFSFDRAVARAEAAEQEYERESTESAPLSPATGARLLDVARTWADRTDDTYSPPTEQPGTEVAADAERTRLAEVTTAAADFYAGQLDTHSETQEYLRGRFGDAAAALRERFTVGYAPNGWRHVTNHLLGQGFSEQEVLDAGVAKQARNGQLIDRMRDRVVVGFRDADGRVAGFAGRPPHEDFDKSRTPKYLNTPATPLFDKSQVVFGLDEQRTAIAAGGVPVLVEGTMDVLALAGVDPQQRIVPLATSGTAVTAAHLDGIRAAGAERVIIALDGDAAGQAAAERTVHRAVSRFDDVRVVGLPDGTDPNDWAQRHASEPDAAARPFLDTEQQRSAADFLAERAIESYFSHHPDQHRAEIEGQVVAAETAARALREVPAAAAVATGARLAYDLGVDPGHMAERIAHHRLTAETSGSVPLAPTTPDTTVAAEPTHSVEPDDDHAEPSQDELNAEAPAAEIEDENTPGTVAVGAAPAELPEPAAVWHQREHGRLGDDELTDRTHAAETRLHRLREQVEAADAHAAQLGSDLSAGSGPHTRELDEHLDDLRQRAELAREADELAEQRQATVERVAAAAEARTLAEAERAELGRFAVRRRGELDEQIASLHHQETTAQAEHEEQAERLGALQAQAGDVDERRRLLTRAAAAERDDEYARPLAAQRDAEVLDRAVRDADRLREQAADAEAEHEALLAEQRARAQLTVSDQDRENAERQATLQPASQLPAEAELDRQHDLHHEHQVAPPELASPEHEHDPGEPEL